MSKDNGEATVGDVINHSSKVYQIVDDGLVGKGGDKIFDLNGSRRCHPNFNYHGVRDHPIRKIPKK